MSLFHMTLGSYEYEEIRETYYQKLTQLVFAVFMVFTPILLLNMLIAMMGNTYCEVIEQSEKEWVKQWANIIVALEKAIDCKSAKEFLQTYSIKMPSPDKETEVRGVIVIKTKLKSKAKEKKQALSLWKRVGKRTIQELRKFGGKASEVRKRYNLFRSKQPTARLRMGKVVQEWNPTPTPVYLDTTTPTNGKSDLAGNNAGFNDLLSKVTSASGMDIEKPTEKVTSSQNKTTDKQNTGLSELSVKPPVNKECADNAIGYVNLAFEGSPNMISSKVPNNNEIQENKLSCSEIYNPKTTTCTCFDKMEKLQSNSLQQKITQMDFTQQNTLTTSVNQVVMQPIPVSSETSQSYQPELAKLQNQENIIRTNSLNEYILKTEPTRWEEPSNVLEKQPQINTPSEQFQTTKEKGISVSIQTKIMSTKITKSKIRRRKDLIFPLRNEYSDSTSEKELKKGFLLYRKQSNGAGLSFRASNKYKRRRKRNQVAFQEKASIDNSHYDIPVTAEKPLMKS